MKATLVEWILGEFWVKWKEMEGNESKTRWMNFGWILDNLKGNESKTRRMNFGLFLGEMKGNERKWTVSTVRLKFPSPRADALLKSFKWL